VFYIVEINKKTGEKWTIEKRYKEFDELNKALKKVYGNLPELPQKTLFSLKQASDIEKRRVDIEKYLQVLSLRLPSSQSFFRLLLPELTLCPLNP